MQRQIFEVQSKTYSMTVGGYVSNISGYPKTFDSHSYGDDIDLTLKKLLKLGVMLVKLITVKFKLFY